jgi:hypothetical protein
LFGQILTVAYYSPESIIGVVFRKLAENYDKIPIEQYINKGTAIIDNINFLIIFLLLMVPTIRLVKTVFHRQIQSANVLFKNAISEIKQVIVSFFTTSAIWLKTVRVLFETLKLWQLWAAASLLEYYLPSD